MSPAPKRSPRSAKSVGRKQSGAGRKLADGKPAGRKSIGRKPSVRAGRKSRDTETEDDTIVPVIQRSRPFAPAKMNDSAADGERLQKVMASAGIGSRRECEQLILDGRVEVDGQVITELGTRVTLGKSDVRFDGGTLAASRPRYYLVNKPVGVVSTNRDQEGRPRVIDLVPPGGHLFAVGRLDRTSEGLILVTNDGELANQLAHPRYEIPKVYRVTVAGSPTRESLQQLRRGVWIAEGPVQVADLKIKKRQSKTTILEMVLTEGRNREIRRMAARIGHKVLELKRIALGPLRLGEIPTGAYRELTPREVSALVATIKGNIRRSEKSPSTGKPHRSSGQGQGQRRHGSGRRIGYGARVVSKSKRDAFKPSIGKTKSGSDADTSSSSLPAKNTKDRKFVPTKTLGRKTLGPKSTKTSGHKKSSRGRRGVATVVASTKTSRVSKSKRGKTRRPMGGNKSARSNA